MSDQRPREFWLAMIYPKNERAPFWSVYDGPVQQDSWVGEQVHVIEATPKTLAAEEMYEALEDLHSFLTSGDVPGGINAAQRIEHVLAKAGKR